MPYEITQCYLPPGRGDFPAFTPAEAGTRFGTECRMSNYPLKNITGVKTVKSVRLTLLLRLDLE